MAKKLIDFDKRWSSLMARKPEDFEEPTELETFYTSTMEFPAGFMTEYTPSLIVGEATHQQLAAGFPIGKRFKSAPVLRVCDTNPLQLGHQATADGRWRIYVFADEALPGTPSKVGTLADWLTSAPDSPLATTPEDADQDAWFDVKVIYQQDSQRLDINAVPAVFKPGEGPFKLDYLEKVFGVDPEHDIFELRGLDRDGVVVIVRPSGPVRSPRPAAHGNGRAGHLLRTNADRAQARGGGGS